MSNLTQFFGGILKPTSIVAGSFEHGIVGATSGLAGGTVVLSGACTANTLKTILSVTGQGAISALNFRCTDATSRSTRCQITIDGVVVFNETTAAVTSSGALASVLGGVAIGNGFGILTHGPALFFDSSLLIEYASSLSETDKVQIQYQHYLR